MKLTRLLKGELLALLCVLLLPLWGQAQQKQRLGVQGDLARWITTTFAKGKTPPFSFVYGGKNAAELLRKWRYEIQKMPSTEAQTLEYEIRYTDPVTGLQVLCEVTGYTEFQTVEWLLRFENTSQQNTPTLEQVKVSDLTVEYETPGTFRVLHSEGSYGARADFRPMLTDLAVGEPLHMAPAGGRSSDQTAFPFFNIVSPTGRGVVVGIGWTGTWFAEVTAAERAVTLCSGMERLKLYLLPGEKIRTPRVCMLFWKGDNLMVGQNQFRRFILAHHSRKIDGKVADYPLSAGFEWGDPAPCNEYGCLTEDFAVALIHRHRQFGIVPEVFWLDAGWYTGSGGPNYDGMSWGNTVGNWTVDTSRFPRGLKPLSDAAHKMGSKFMVWFEPERVMAGSQFAVEHPEWMLRLEGNDTYLFDLGNPEACAWLCRYIGDLLETNGIDYYRQDFNMYPAPYWEANEDPQRIGIREIRHIEGLYTYWDYLLHRFPKLMIDNCASGGRRLDLETTTRSAPLWRTDYQYGEVNGYQCHTYGLNLFLPMHGTGIYATDPYSVYSCLSSAMVINWEITSNRVSIPDMQRVIGEFKMLRPYFYEDYYPLTGFGDLTGDDVWLAYQLNRPSDGSGVVMAFRRKDNPQESLTVQLQGLQADATYTVQSETDGSLSTHSGAELAQGLSLTIPQTPGAVMLRYSLTSASQK